MYLGYSCVLRMMFTPERRRRELFFYLTIGQLPLRRPVQRRQTPSWIFSIYVVKILKFVSLFSQMSQFSLLSPNRWIWPIRVKSSQIPFAGIWSDVGKSQLGPHWFLFLALRSRSGSYRGHAMLQLPASMSTFLPSDMRVHSWDSCRNKFRVQLMKA